MYKAFRKDGMEVQKGDEITDFRGEIWIFSDVPQNGKNRVFVKKDGMTREFFPSVFDLEIHE